MSLDTLLSILFLLVFIVLPLLSRALRRGPGAGRGAPGRPPGREPGPADAETPPWLAEAQRRVRDARQAQGGDSRRASTAAPERTLVPEDPFGREEPPPGDRTLVPEDPFGRRAEPRREGTLVHEDAQRGTGAPARPRTLVPDDPFEGGLAQNEEPRQPASTGRTGAPAPTAGPAGTAAAGRAAPQAGAPRGAAAPPKAPAGTRRTPRAAGTPGYRAARRRRAGSRLGGVWVVGVAGSLGTAAHERRGGPSAGARLGLVDLMRFDRREIVSGLIWHEILDEPAWKRRQRRVSSRPRSR